jgi:site-specific recombinase XerD
LGHELTPRSISEFLHDLNCRNAKHLYYGAIRALCGWLCKEGYLQDNPMGRVDAPKVSKRLLPTVTPEQLDILVVLWFIDSMLSHHLGEVVWGR